MGKAINSELIRKIKEDIDIVDYARHLGYTPERVSPKYWSLKEHDSVRIDISKNTFYRFSNGAHGSVIDFSMHFRNLSLEEALQELGMIVDPQNEISKYYEKDFDPNLYKGKPKYKREDDAVKEAKQIKRDNEIKEMIEKEQMAKKALNKSQSKDIRLDIKEREKKEDMSKFMIPNRLPQRAENERHVWAYLTKTRCIAREIVKEFIDEKMLYEEYDKRNCVFVAYDEDEKPNFAIRKTSSTFAKFEGIVSNSDSKKAFFINNNANKVAIIESVIDAMSVMTLKLQRGDNPRDYDYIVLAGSNTKYKEPTIYHLKEKEKKYEQLTLMLDTDEAGCRTIKGIQELLKEENIDIKAKVVVPVNMEKKDFYKDWNEKLQAETLLKKNEMEYEI